MSQSTGKMKLAVLTSGGDSAGMNAVVRAIVKIGILRCVPILTSSSYLTSINIRVTEAAKHGLYGKDTRDL